MEREHPDLPDDSTTFEGLDPKVIQLWRITGAIGNGILLSLLLVPCLIVAFMVGGWGWWLLVAWAALAAWLVFWVVWHPARAWQAWGYRLDGRVFETRSGIWWKVVRLLPLSRLQHVDLQRGPLERAFGLASLTLHTAGTQQAAIVVPGLAADRARELRDRLVTVGGDDGV